MGGVNEGISSFSGIIMTPRMTAPWEDAEEMPERDWDIWGCGRRDSNCGALRDSRPLLIVIHQPNRIIHLNTLLTTMPSSYNHQKLPKAFDDHRIPPPQPLPWYLQRGAIFTVLVVHTVAAVLHHVAAVGYTYVAISPLHPYTFAHQTARWWTMAIDISLPPDLGSATLATLQVDLGLTQFCTSTAGNTKKGGFGCEAAPQCSGDRMCGLWTAGRAAAWCAAAMTYVGVVGLLVLSWRGYGRVSGMVVVLTGACVLIGSATLTLLFFVAVGLKPLISRDFTYLEQLSFPVSGTTATPLSVAFGGDFYMDLFVAVVEIGVGIYLIAFFRHLRAAETRGMA
ncbi:hypothetical protein HK101_008724 [Irineochytrium annulatum]|nr:hypothetical protein HK101_008724 [Irineochytrium annulatum]